MRATLGSRLLIHVILLAVALPILVIAWPHLERLIDVPSDALLLVIAAIFFVTLYDIGSYAAQAAENSRPTAPDPFYCGWSKSSRSAFSRWGW